MLYPRYPKRATRCPLCNQIPAPSPSWIMGRGNISRGWRRQHGHYYVSWTVRANGPSDAQTSGRMGDRWKWAPQEDSTMGTCVMMPLRLGSSFFSRTLRASQSPWNMSWKHRFPLLFRFYHLLSCLQLKGSWHHFGLCTTHKFSLGFIYLSPKARSNAYPGTLCVCNANSGPAPKKISTVLLQILFFFFSYLRARGGW